MKIKVLYFASLRDSSDTAEEMVETTATNIDQLYNELNIKYNFPLAKEDLRAAQNESYVSFNNQLNENDTIVFIPPVAGG